MNDKKRQLFFPFPARKTFFDGRLLRQLRLTLVFGPRCLVDRVCRQRELFDPEPDDENETGYPKIS